MILKLKSKITLCVFYLCFCFLANAQDMHKVTYKIDPINILEPLEGERKSYRDIMKSSIDYAKNLEYILLIDKYESSFSQKKFLQFDNSLMKDVHESTVKSFTNFNDATYLIIREDSLLFKRNFFNINYVVKKDFYNFNWKIQKDTKEILNQKSYLAKGRYYDLITGKSINIEAWFIPSIPVKIGPDIYTGLPGLIVEVHLPKVIVKATNIKEIKNESIELPKKEELMSFKEYERLIERLNKKLKKL